MKKHIYLLQSDNGVYKIGVSKDPQKRLKQLQTGSSEKLEIIKTYESEFYRQIEKGLHNKFNHLRSEGEWFYLHLEDELRFIKECERIENNIKLLKESGNPFV